MLPVIQAIISNLLANNLPKVAQAVADKGVEYVNAKLGVELKPEMSPVEIKEVSERAMQHEEFMTEQANKNTADARDMQKIGNSKMPAFLSIITVLGFFTLLIGSAFDVLKLTGSDIMMLLLGVLARETASVYNFWLGSSNSSQQKDLLRGGK